MTVWMALALISGPAIGPSPTEVGCRSFRRGAVAPTTTTFPRIADAGTFPSSTSRNE